VKQDLIKKRIEKISFRVKDFSSLTSSDSDVLNVGVEKKLFWKHLFFFSDFFPCPLLNFTRKIERKEKTF